MTQFQIEQQHGRYLVVNLDAISFFQVEDVDGRKGIQIMPKLTGASGQTVTFQNGMTTSVMSVVWAVGYKDDSDWVHIPEVKDAQGNFTHQKGIAPIRNLYFIGRPWQITTGSARIYGVGQDAAWIAKEIRRNLS